MNWNTLENRPALHEFDGAWMTIVSRLFHQQQRPFFLVLVRFVFIFIEIHLDQDMFSQRILCIGVTASGKAFHQ